MNDIRIGTSGWSYPTGRGTWNGIFYPTAAARRAREKQFDELAYYARYFDTVEINSTFYRPPTAAIAKRWVDRTPAGFEFSLKLYQKFTHPKMFRQATQLQSAGELDAAGLPQVDQMDVDAFRAGLDPIASSGKLGALLAQFPPSFRDTPDAREYLARLLGTFRAYPVAIELRHRSWSDGIASTLALLNEYGAAWVQIDEPKFRFSIRQNYLPNVKGFYYMRLHGRNVDKWWRHEKAEDRYDYLYSPEELKPFAETATAVRALVKKLYLYLNNHFAAKSVADALLLKGQVGQQTAAPVPATLVEQYPMLQGAVPAPAAEDDLFRRAGVPT